MKLRIVLFASLIVVLLGCSLDASFASKAQEKKPGAEIRQTPLPPEPQTPASLPAVPQEFHDTINHIVIDKTTVEKNIAQMQLQYTQAFTQMQNQLNHDNDEMVTTKRRAAEAVKLSPNEYDVDEAKMIFVRKPAPPAPPAKK